MTPPPGPPPSMALRTALLFLRFFTIAALFASIIVLTTNSAYLEIASVELKLHFKDIYAYRYMLATIVMGMAYTLLQIIFTLYYISTGNRIITGDGSFTFDFFGDKIVSYLLATGAAAGFGATKDMKSVFQGVLGDTDKFFNKGYASASLLLIAFVCTAMLSVFSSYALPKRI
ncbi:hypothetical protein LWI29_017934 [Acer saccharum]|uniref:CASP-like protein n=1 Tax=Acer saccharum TaxID=4024 RepID=A0AA39SJ76_ACESA|nr:hypothetical protein LWI29_017934 [Acer saccharum]